MRVDVDLFSSTLDVLTSLYSLLSPGGFCIIDDYGSVAECEAAVDQFRAQSAIDSPMHWIDSDAVWWRVPWEH